MRKLLVILLALGLCSTAWGANDQAMRFPSGTPMAVVVPGGSGSVPTGGTTNQVLKKNSNTNYDVGWGAGGGSPGGSDTQMQFNDATAFGGDPDLLYTKGTNLHTVTGTWNYSGGHTWYIPTTGDIATAITNASAGDTIQLGAGKYTLTAGVTCNKLLHIMGKGRGITTITTSTADINMLTFNTTNGSALSDLTLQTTAANTAAWKAMVTIAKNVNIWNVEFKNAATGASNKEQHTVYTSDTSTSTIENCTFNSTGVIGDHLGVFGGNGGTVTIRNCTMTGSGGTGTYGNIVVGVSGAGDVDAYNSYIVDSTSAAGSGVVSSLTNAMSTIHFYDCIVGSAGGTSYEVLTAWAVGLYLYDCTLLTNSTYGPIVYAGTVVTGQVNSGNITPLVDSTYDLGTSLLRWSHLYLDPSSLNIGTNANNCSVTYDTGASSLGLNKDLNISKTAPELRLTDVSTLYARETKVTASNEYDLKNQVYGVTLGADQVPTMTSNTLPSGVCSSSALQFGRAAWNAFDHSLSSYWAASGMPCYVQYQFASPTVITGYNVYTRTTEDTVGRSPKNWTLLASNTGAFAGEQVTLDTRTNQFNYSTTALVGTYYFTNSTAYSYYRLNITANWGAGAATTLSELELCTSTSATYEATIAKSADSGGLASYLYGSTTFGDGGGLTNLNGQAINFQINGTTYADINSSGVFEVQPWTNNYAHIGWAEIGGYNSTDFYAGSIPQCANPVFAAIRQNTGNTWINAGLGSGGSIRFYIDGHTYGLLQNTSPAWTFYSYLSTNIAQVVKGASSQSADLTQWQDSSSGVLASVSATGAVTALGFTSNSAAYGLTLKQGANGKCGTFIANGITPVTVSNTSVAITDTIVFSLNTVGGVVGAYPAIQTITAATGFTVACTAGDISTYNYIIISNQP